MTWKEYINDYVTRHNFDPIDIAKYIGASRQSVIRWMEGINEPHPVMQEAFKRILEEKESK